MKLPVRVPPFQFEKVVVVRVFSINPYHLKFAIRDVARKFPEYFAPIELEIPVSGQSDNGEKISINTLGKWLFGVPGFMGHYKQEVNGNEVSIWIPPIREAQDLVLKAVRKLTTEGIVEIM